MPADPRLVGHARRKTGTATVKLPRPIVRDEANPDRRIKIIHEDGTMKADFDPIASEGNVRMVADVSGRQEPSYFLELAQGYVDKTTSSRQTFNACIPPMDKRKTSIQVEEIQSTTPPRV